MIKQERIATKLNQSTENSSANASVSLEIAMAEENDSILIGSIQFYSYKS